MVVTAVDAARALGADIDARCQTLRSIADAATAALAQTLARLAPWKGDAPALLELPRIGRVEIDEARAKISDLATEADRELATAARATEEAAALALQMEQLASGNAVSADEIGSARVVRDEKWRSLRDHMLTETLLDAPREAVAAFEATLAEADERSDLRFAAADESSRPADMGNRAAKLLLDAKQAELRAEVADGRLAALRTAWREKLAAAGHADMDPTYFLGWNIERDMAEAAYDAAVAAVADADATVTLRWAIEQYRVRHQDPMLLRASELFATLTIGRYAALRIDNDAGTPRLLGLRDDGRTVVEVGAMSEGTTDQLFLALRLAAVEQSVAAGIRLPFLADDLFVNFDDDRSEAGFRVLAELAKSTQILFFTHHPHLAAIARSVVGAGVHSECALG